MRSNYFALAALAIAAAAMVPSAGQLPAITDAVVKAQDAAREGRYLVASEMLRAAAVAPDGTPRKGPALMMWRQLAPFITNEIDPALFRSASVPPATPQMLLRLRTARPHDAIAEIVARARKTRIVILNEAHYSPRDRAFALEVARALRPLGYSVLAAETFDNGPGALTSRPPIAQLQADGFVRRGTGFYTLDPVYAGFVREALKLGYRPVAYEQVEAKRPGDLQEREDTQADNLMNAVFRKDAQAKVLIYVGHGHVDEATHPPEYATMMAAKLKQASKIDPLTIDQTGLSDLNADPSIYAAASANVGAHAAILFDGANPVRTDSFTERVDLQVVHPHRTYRYGRPTWLGALGGKPMDIPKALRPRDGRRLVQAFAADAPEDAVPLDQVLLVTGRPVPKLLVPTRHVRLAIQDAP